MRVINKQHWPFQIKKIDKDPLERATLCIKFVRCHVGNAEIKEWLRENESSYVFNGNSSTYCFQHEEDAVMFKLTWGS